MNQDEIQKLEKYNEFCKTLNEGTILYNIDPNNSWGEYLLVINVIKFDVADITTYTAVLLSLKKEEGKYISLDKKINLTPSKAMCIQFLKYVGYAKYDVHTNITECDVNIGMVAVYGSIDLRKFARNLEMPKQRNARYDNDGKLTVRNLNNK